MANANRARIRHQSVPPGSPHTPVDSAPRLVSRTPDSEPTACAPCVARLHSPAERLHYVRARLREETDPLVTLTHLLQVCRD